MSLFRLLPAIILVATVVFPLTAAQAQQLQLTAEQEKRLTGALEARQQMQTLHAQGRPREALVPAKKALDIIQEVIGLNNKYAAASLNDLGFLHQAVGEYAQARPLYDQALKIREEVLGPDDVETGESINNIGFLLHAQGHYRAAKPYYERALAIFKKARGEEDATVATSYNNLAVLLQAEGDYTAARPYYEQALAIRRKKLGDKDPLTTLSVNNLAFLHEAIGDYDTAQKYYEQALAIRRQVQGERHIDTAVLLHNLGSLHENRHDYLTSKKFYEQALSIRKEKLGMKHPDTALTLNGIGSVLDSLRQYDAAQAYFEQALAIRMEVKGAKHPETASALNNLGYLHKNLGNYAKARDYHRQSLAIRREVQGDSHPDVGASLSNLAWIEAVTGQWAAAAVPMHEHQQLIRRHITRVLPGLNENEQLIYLKTEQRTAFYVALSLGIARPGDSKLAALSATWLVNGKAIAQETLAARELLSRDERIVSPAEAKKLAIARNQLAAWVNHVPTPQTAAQRKQRIAALQDEVQLGSRKLAAARGQSELADGWVELDRVRAALPKGGVLVDLMRLEVANFAHKGDEERFGNPRYVAWITPPAGNVAIVDLGDAQEIDKLVADYQQAMAAATGAEGKKALLDELGEPEAEARLNKALRPLAARVLDPLRPHLKDARQVVLSPDGPLWLAPWAALPDAQGQYALEQYEFRYVVSARDLVSRSAAKFDVQRPVIVADPNFDLPRGKVAGAASGTKASLEPPPQILRSADALPRVSRLPGTAAEAKAIAPSIETFTQAQPRTLLADEAVERAIKTKEYASPRVLVFSTHGYFLPEQPPQASLAAADLKGRPRSAAAVAKDGQRLENPLLRCGLLLAGCNTRAAAADATSDDGILTGLEIVGCDLRGTELVVLSACETGVGQVNNGEGVAGLRQAFQLAGARSVVSTLWQIPDKESAQLMTNFFANLAAGQSKSEALRTAQIKMIAARRERHSAAHPLFWAAYTVTGN